MERIPPELGAATGQRHELIVEGRKELLYLERLVAEQVLASFRPTVRRLILPGAARATVAQVTTRLWEE